MSLGAFKARFDRERLQNRQELENDLRFLKEKVERALVDLKSGEDLDEHLIHNAGGITKLIARHNTYRWMKAYLEPPKEEG